MFLPLEKLIILKTVDTFAGTADDVLMELAGILVEERFEAEQLVFLKGDEGTSMYIIAQGRARVHDGEKTFRVLEEREIFGELALIDAEKRSASITAVEETILFRLDQGAFFELIADRFEVCEGLIRVITNRIRTLRGGQARRPPPGAPSAPTGSNQ